MSTASGLRRPRLISRLASPDSYRVARVVAPAGFGKSRLLTHISLAYPGKVAWCGSPDPVPRSDAAFARWVSAALAPLVREEITDSVDAICAWAPDPGAHILLVMDDAHLLEGSEAETALDQLVQKLPPRVNLLIGSRSALALDLSRRAVSGEAIEIGQDDLRFRTWEVEELFRDVYHDPLLPEDVAVLARRTGGWAAYLQLFHLATARKGPSDRRQVLQSLAQRPQLVQEYLNRHVLSGLSPEIQDFLVRTCVLRRPSPALCDEMLGRESGSSGVLAGLERRHLLVERMDDGCYRYHPVLLAYLDAKLVETIGSVAAREEHRRAAGLLEREGLSEDALAAFARAEDWDGVARTLGHTNSRDGLGDAWLEALAPNVIETDPMLLMARARRALASGALADAVKIMRRAESLSASSAVAEQCRLERERVAIWASAERVTPGDDWGTILRAATQKSPDRARRLAQSYGGAAARLAEGLCAFIVGDMHSAHRLLRLAASDPSAPPSISAGARIAGTVAGIIGGRFPTLEELARFRDEIDACAAPWLDRLSRAALAASDGATTDVLEDLEGACQREGDRWGACVVAFASGVGHMCKGLSASACLERAADGFAELGAPVLEATARAYLGLALIQEGDRQAALAVAGQARAAAHMLEIPAVAGIAALTLARLHGDPAELERSRTLLEPLGSWKWHEELGVGEQAVAPTPYLSVPVTLRCLGGFRMTIGDKVVQDSSAKPMERAVLHLLAMHAGRPVHREAMVEALWPKTEPKVGLHRLQVAMSAVRRILADAGNAELLVRQGDSYLLRLPEGSDVDVWRIEASMRRATEARSCGDAPGEEEGLSAALAAYRGTLLPGAGPAEWVIERRTQIETTAAQAATRLATIYSGDRPALAVQVARAGLAVDRYNDELWRVLIEASLRAGNHAEANRARTDYAGVLSDLGI